MYPRMEREFDIMVKKATPYLIFSPDAIRDAIADYMKSAWRAMRTNNINDFDLHCTNINDVIAKSDGQTEDALQIDISDFDRRYLSLDQSISELKKELLELKAAIRGTKKEPNLIIEGEEKKKRGRQKKETTYKQEATRNDAIPNIFPQVENSIPQVENSIPQVENSIPQVENSIPQVENSIPQVQDLSNFKCPSCGKRLTHISLKNSESYYCFPSRKGCGKRYIIDANGNLAEKILTTTLSYTCQCGLELHPKGKEKIDDELYQIYVCKSKPKGGCGKSYIRDKNGDLHIGSSKMALSRPKVLKPQED